MLDFAFWYTSLLLVLMTIALVKELFEAEIVVFSTLVLLILGRVISIQDAFIGFSNQGMLTVGFFFVVAGAMQKTGVLNQLSHYFLGRRTGTITAKLLRFIFPVSAFSAFFNNTPIVAMLIPTIRYWARKHDYALSKFLIPLSYAAILGGMCTLIGTSTNLVVHGLMIKNHFRGFSLFEMTKVGLPVAVIGLAAIALLGHRLLPERKEAMAELGERTREFVIEMKVMQNYEHLGQAVKSAGLRHLKGLFLFQIERDDHAIIPVTPDEKILLGDRLFFTGLPETIVELQKTTGLSLLKECSFDLKNYDSDAIKTFEVVISPNSPLIGKNVRESEFRNQYDAVIIAIPRSGERIRKKIGDVVLRVGDTLLILAKKDFLKKWYHSRDFNLVSESAEIPSKPKRYTRFSLGILIGMILLMAFNIVPIIIAVSLAALLFVLSKCITSQDAWKSVDWNVLLIIASAFGISRAMSNSGVADFIGREIVLYLGSFGIIGLLAGVYFTTSFYTEIITNNAAAALMFPIALAVTQQAGLEPRPFFIIVALAASASFATPIGYQTNLMVYGPGGYKFRDFMKIGIPMNVFIGVLVIFMAYVLYFA